MATSRRRGRPPQTDAASSDAASSDTATSDTATSDAASTDPPASTPAPRHAPAAGAPAPATPARRRPYHHGRLRQAMVEAALALAHEKGPEGVSVREAARRVGVSSGAPFRHFPTRQALMGAVAIEAGERLQLEARRDLARAGAQPVAQLRALGHGYLRWAQDHPAHFRVVSARDQLDLAGDARLQDSVQAVRGWAEALMARALAEQALGPRAAREDAATLALLARACAYGLARMRLDGHLPQWGVAAGTEPATLQRLLDLFIDLLAAPAPAPAPGAAAAAARPARRRPAR